MLSENCAFEISERCGSVISWWEDAKPAPSLAFKTQTLTPVCLQASSLRTVRLVLLSHSVLSLHGMLRICVCVCMCFLLSLCLSCTPSAASWLPDSVCVCLCVWMCASLPEWNVSLISLLLLEGRKGGLYSVISASLRPPLSPPTYLGTHSPPVHRGF